MLPEACSGMNALLRRTFGGVPALRKRRRWHRAWIEAPEVIRIEAVGDPAAHHDVPSTDQMAPVLIGRGNVC